MSSPSCFIELTQYCIYKFPKLNSVLILLRIVFFCPFQYFIFNEPPNTKIEGWVTPFFQNFLKLTRGMDQVQKRIKKINTVD